MGDLSLDKEVTVFPLKVLYSPNNFYFVQFAECSYFTPHFSQKLLVICNFTQL